MDTKQLYEKVSEILGPVSDHSGGYFSKNAWALHFKQITVRQFVDAMLIADDVFSDGIAELRLIRFPKESQRNELAKLIEGLGEFRHGLTAVIKTAESGEQRWEVSDKYFDKSYKATVDYWDNEEK